MVGEAAGDARDQVRMNLLVRPDQHADIKRLARESDLMDGQVVRRLLDLGLASWRAQEVRVTTGVSS